ncbi:MAG: polysaccharide deacetylase family protein [Actinomycetota bacterium]|nr:polysaccharide deacetylase family protein [Actinomycetota bacterium]
MPALAVRRAIEVLGQPIDVLARRRPCARFVALIYHRVGGGSPSPVDLPADRFAAHLDRVAGRVVTLDEALALASPPAPGGAQDTELGVADASLPKVVLTFDDGTADWLDVVLPMLADRSLPAVFYVSTGYVEGERSLPDGGRAVGWSGLAELAASGLATIGSHTHTHRILAGVPAVEAIEELDRSRHLIEDRLGVSCDHFAYPNAVAGSPSAEVAVRRRFSSAALAGNRTNLAGRTDPHRLGRHALGVDDSMRSFDHKTAGGARLEGVLRERRDALRCAVRSA